MNGFKAWYKTDGLNCGFWASQGVFPSSLIALKDIFQAINQLRFL
jgi:hypothetical protein